ncbi:MAG: hypothetical protein KIY11_05110 [Thermoplasmata archaeon]|nr:hypothetical protein [Candidatus Sysuiplasma acidicola]
MIFLYVSGDFDFQFPVSQMGYFHTLPPLLLEAAERWNSMKIQWLHNRTVRIEIE